jgi:hypothetical protein
MAAGVDEVSCACTWRKILATIATATGFAAITLGALGAPTIGFACATTCLAATLIALLLPVCPRRDNNLWLHSRVRELSHQ